MMEIIYGPVSSWRLGRSLGIDLICKEEGKVCSFDCIYCSLGRTTEKTLERKLYVPTDLMEEDLRKTLKEVDADIITFSGTGEPTLALNLGEAIMAVRKITDLPVAVLTNSTLMVREDVRRELAKADVIKGKLDAPNGEVLEAVNRPHQGVGFEELVKGMKLFRKGYRGKFSIEVMFVPQNVRYAGRIAEVIKEIGPDEVQINTPTRPSPVGPLTPKQIEEIEENFKTMNFISVYRAERVRIEKIVGGKKVGRLKRREGGGSRS